MGTVSKKTLKIGHSAPLIIAHAVSDRLSSGKRAATAVAFKMSEVFPETNIVCCDAHLKRAVRRHIQTCHHKTAYDTNISFQTFVRHLWGLSLVPLENILSVWGKLHCSKYS